MEWMKKGTILCVLIGATHPQNNMQRDLLFIIQALPKKPGKEVGHWPSHSGGYGTAMKPGTYLVDSKNKRDVRHLNDGSRGWKSWAYVIYTENGKELRGAEGSRVMLHNDDLDPPTKKIPARGTTHGCHGILDESSNSGELKPKGNLPKLLKNADERMVPLIVEEI